MSQSPALTAPAPAETEPAYTERDYCLFYWAMSYTTFLEALAAGTLNGTFEIQEA